MIYSDSLDENICVQIGFRAQKTAASLSEAYRYRNASTAYVRHAANLWPLSKRCFLFTDTPLRSGNSSLENLASGMLMPSEVCLIASVGVPLSTATDGLH